LHKIPLINLPAIDLIISESPMLKTLAVFNCEQIHIGEVPMLLAIANEHNIANLDVYPKYHRASHVGGRDYGVSWGQLNMDVRAGIMLTLFDIWRISKATGLELLSRHKQFRLWLEDQPSLKGEVADAICAFETYNYWMSRPQKGLRKTAPTDHNAEICMRQKVLVDDIVAVIRGRRAILPNYPVFALNSQEWSTCSGCSQSRPVSLFSPALNRRTYDYTICFRCALANCLDNQNNHHQYGAKEKLSEIIFPHIRRRERLRKVPTLRTPGLSNWASISINHVSTMRDFMTLAGVLNRENARQGEVWDEAQHLAFSLDVKNKSFAHLHLDDEFTPQEVEWELGYLESRQPYHGQKDSFW
jgi:hypothetical protein